METVIPWL